MPDSANKQDADKMKASDIVAPQEVKILLWFFGSLLVGFVWAPAWVVTVFLGISVLPLLIPKLLMMLCAYGADHSRSDMARKGIARVGVGFYYLFWIIVGLAVLSVLANPSARF